MYQTNQHDILGVDTKSKSGYSTVHMGASRPKPGDTFMVPVLMDESAAALTMLHAQWQTYNGLDERLPGISRYTPEYTKYWDKSFAKYGIRANGWKPIVGGFTFVVRDQQTKESTRATAIWEDSAMGRVIAHQDATRKRGSLFLQLVEGRWYAHIRYTNFGRQHRHGRVGINTRRAMLKAGFDPDNLVHRNTKGAPLSSSRPVSVEGEEDSSS